MMEILKEDCPYGWMEDTTELGARKGVNGW